MYSKVSQLYTHTRAYILFQILHLLDCYRILTRVLCAIQYVLVGYLYTQQCVYVNPRLLMYLEVCESVKVLVTQSCPTLCDPQTVA